jgi:hypothetical protein
MLHAGDEVLQAGVKGPCLHRPENWLVRQLTVEPKLSRPAGHISVGSEPRRGRMKGQETRRRQQDRSSDQAAKFYCSHRGIYVLRE